VLERQNLELTLFNLQVLNSQYTFDGLYLGCVAENMEELHPFGDVPRKLASSVKRSLVAARALVKALRTGHEIANQMTKVRLVLISDIRNQIFWQYTDPGFFMI